MRRMKEAVLLLVILGISACSNDAVSPRRTPEAAGGRLQTNYPTLDAEIDALIGMLFPNNGLVTAADERWDGVKAALAAGKIDVARKQLTNLSTWISKKALVSRQSEAARLTLDMALYVYNGPGTTVPGNVGDNLQTAAGVVEPTTSLTLTTTHQDGSVGDGGIHLDVGSVSTTTIAIISEVTGAYTDHCSGPLIYSGCQEPKFFRITLFPHDKLLKKGQVQICHVTNGLLRHPLGDHDDLRVAHEKPAKPDLYTPGSTIVDGIEILPFSESINVLGTSGEEPCQASYDNSYGEITFFDRYLGRDNGITKLAHAIGKALTPKTLYAIDQGGGGEFLSESIFGLVNSKIKLTDGCINNCPNPVLALKSTADEEGGTRYNLTVTNRASYPNQIFAATSSLPPCGDNLSSSRTWVDIYDAATNERLYGFCALGGSADLDNIWLFVDNESPPASIYIKMTDRLTGLVYPSNTITLPPPAGNCTSECPAPVLALKSIQDSPTFRTYNLTVTNRSVYSDVLFAAAPDLPSCGGGENGAKQRTWVNIYDASTNEYIYGFCGLGAASDLDLIWFSVPVSGPFPGGVYITMTDRLTGAIYQSNVLSLTF